MPGSESHLPGGKPHIPMDTSNWATAKRLWQKSYAADYLGFIILLVLYINLHLFITPFHQYFYLNDHRILFPHAEKERVPPWVLLIYAGAAPLVVLIVWLLISRSGVQKFHITVLGLLISLILTSFVTDVIKNAVGRPRPDLIDRCKPRADAPRDKLVSIDICTETRRHVLQDGWRSFPSGHSSFAFSGLGYLALFFASHSFALRPGADLTRMLLVLAPLLGAALIAISRLEDYRHDVFDVTIGSALGLTLAYLTWRRHYPPLSSAGCDTPHTVALQEAGAQQHRRGFRRVRDEEDPGSEEE